MDAPVHFVTSAALAAALYPFFGWMSAFALVGGFLIDIDHYFWFVHKTRRYGFKDCYNFYLDPHKEGDYFRHKDAFLAFHTIEIPVLLIALSFVHVAFLTVLAGLLLHFMLDAVYRIRKLKMLFITPPSAIAYLISLNKNTAKA